MKNLLLIPAVLFILSVFGCSQPPITVESFKDYSKIKKGEQAKISWEFKNADKVQVLSNNENFGYYSIHDSLIVLPEKNQTFNIIAFNSFEDSLEMNSLVIVDNGISGSEDVITVDDSIDEDEVNPQRGPVLFKQQTFDISYEKSDFIKGVFEATKLTEPKNLKIVGIDFFNESKKKSMKALVLDEFGNFLQGYEHDEFSQWNTQLKCKSKNFQTPEISISLDFLNPDNNFDIAFLFDNSAAQFDGEAVLNSIQSSLYYLTQNDNILFSIFNQNYNQIFALSPVEKALWELQNIEISNPDGLSSLYKSSFLTLDLLSKGESDNKYLVILTYNSDNSSIIYTANNVIDRARRANIPIYVVGIGNTLETYSLRYLANATGGKFYHILDFEIDLVKDVLNEITFANRNSYSIEINEADFSNCNIVDAKTSLNIFDYMVFDKTKIILKPDLNYIKYQALVNFDENDKTIYPKYENVINSLAYVLKLNPEQTILLIGHSGNEGKSEENMKLSIDRAKEVKKLLISLGVNSKQIETRGIGNHKPIFYVSEKSWKQKYNRRVEIKWLDPEIKPFEIVLPDLFRSEESASKYLDKWENRGFKAYYDRYILDNDIYYQIRLWDYATKSEAEKKAKIIKSKYRKNVTIE